jgi:hypothetical protein
MRTLFRWDINNAPLAPDHGVEQRPSIHVSFVRPDPNDPRFKDDEPPRQIGQRPYPGEPAPAGTKLLEPPRDRPMPNLSRKGSWMD